MGVDDADRERLDAAPAPTSPDGSVGDRGYYTDPLGGSRRRFWDGEQWSIVVEEPDAATPGPEPGATRSRGVTAAAIGIEAATVRSIGSVIAAVGWVGAVLALISGLVLWADLSDDGFDALEYTTAQKLDIVFGSVALAVLGSILVAGIGHALRLFALHVAHHART
jgi:hypothetical protein